MRYRSKHVPIPVATLILALSVSIGLPAFQGGSQDQKQAPQSDSKQKVSALTGCIDEQDGHYVLIDARTMSPIANLDADGFQTEGFAKHVGHTVTVRGTSISTSTRPTFKVRSIETLSQSCEPHQGIPE